MTYTVEASEIRKSFGGRPALDGVDLAVGAGSVLALLGPNGAGKTTMVRVLATLTRPDSGSATVAGHDLLADPLGVRRSISLTGQFVAVDDVLSGRENLDLMARLRHLRPAAARARTNELLEEFDLTDAADRRAATYSGGMRRRLDLAIAMIERPTVLFLDEPTTGLDLRSREALWEAVEGMVAEGVTILLTTQYLEEADRLADTIAILDEGRIVAHDTPAELKGRLGVATVRLRFPDAESWRHARRSLIGARADEARRTLELASGGTAGSVHAELGSLIAAGLPMPEVSIHRPTLDDVFLGLTDHGPAGRQAGPKEMV